MKIRRGNKLEKIMIHRDKTIKLKLVDRIISPKQTKKDN